MSLVMRTPAFCICEKQRRTEADQRLYFCYIDSTIPLLIINEFQASSHLLWQYSPVYVGPGRKPLRLVFSQRGSYKERKQAKQYKQGIVI